MYRAVLAALLAIGVVADARAVPITYDIQSYLSVQNGWSLSGTITTDGKLGAITSADITNWDFTLTNGATTVSSGSPLAAIVTGTLLATDTSLTLPIPSSGSENALQLGNGFFDFPLIEWARGSAGPYPAGDFYHSRNPGTETYWTDNVSTGTLPLPTAGEPFVIATVGAATAPEPSTLTLVLVSLGSLAVFRQARRRLAAASSPEQSPCQSLENVSSLH